MTGKPSQDGGESRTTGSKYEEPDCMEAACLLIGHAFRKGEASGTLGTNIEESLAHGKKLLLELQNLPKFENDDIQLKRRQAEVSVKVSIDHVKTALAAIREFEAHRVRWQNLYPSVQTM